MDLTQAREIAEMVGMLDSYQEQAEILAGEMTHPTSTETMHVTLNLYAEGDAKPLSEVAFQATGGGFDARVQQVMIAAALVEIERIQAELKKELQTR